MGSGRWDSGAWSSYSSAHVNNKPVHEIYDRRMIHSDLDPKKINIRESRDSIDNNNSNAIIIGLDVTGSMSMVLNAIIKNLNTLVTEIHSRKPVTDPHIMFMGIGDVRVGDRAPLQCTQFEADIRIAEQLKNIYLEEGGGGNHFESYALAWYFAAMHTSIDCFEKRNKKGYLFTIGDEAPTPDLTASELRTVLNIPEIGKDKLTMYELYDMACRQYNVFHIMIEEGSYYRRSGDKVRKEWTQLIGENAIPLSDHNKLSEVIVSTIQLNEGEDFNTVVNSWDGSTNLVVAKAIQDLTSKSSDTNNDIVVF